MGVTISRKKFQCGHSIPFAGFLVSSGGISPDPAQSRAIAAFPSPKNIHDLRSFMGLASQLGIFLPDLEAATGGIRKLLKKEAAWQWTEDHQQELDKAKGILTSPLLVRPFDSTLNVELLTDASRLNS